MKLFTAGVATETNTFSPMPTGYDQYAESLLARHGVPDDAPAGAQPLVVWRRRARAAGWQLVESLYAAAQPAGLTTRSVYEGFRAEILADLEAALPVDAVLLNLHGAMVAEGYDDCEGDLLGHVRALTGPGVPIGAELDPHCHLTAAMVQHADALICYKEYPHTDQSERAEELFSLIAATAAGEVRPHMAVYDCRMISNFFTTSEPMRSYVAQLKEHEREPGVLSISVAHGFPWGDVPEMGTRLLVVTDGSPQRGAELAEQLGRQLIGLRGRTHAPYLSLEESLRRALAAPDSMRGGPVVIADVSDNAGGGAPSDNTEFLRALIERDVQGAALAMIWDPVAVSMAFAAGEGASVTLRLGGKLGPSSGTPLDATFQVTRLVRDAHMSFAGQSRRVGDAAALRVGGIDVVANTLRTQTTHPDLFTNVGIDYAAKRLLVIKSAQHFRAGFEPIAAEILYAAAPGAIMPLFDRIPYRRAPERIWPRVPGLHDDIPVTG
jgi:microcystin degradation protein MlrC